MTHAQDSLPNLDGLTVFLSASLPDELEQTPRALDLESFVATFLRGLLTAGGRLVFGGHPTVTPLVHRVARDFGEKKVDLYQLQRYCADAPPEIHEPEFELHCIDSEDLASLRETMIERAQAGVFLGGRTHGYQGDLPGIRDEYERFLAHHPEGPAYVLGLLDGEASRIICEMNGHQEPNGLAPREREALHHTTNVDLTASLILADLRRSVRRRETVPV